MERFGIEGYASHHRKGFILTVLGHCILNVVMLFFKVGPGRQSCLLRGEREPVLSVSKSSAEPQPSTYTVTTEIQEYVTYRKVSEDKNLDNFCHIN